MRKVFLTISLLAIFALSGCSPAAMSIPMTPIPSTSPVSPVATPVVPQSTPTAMVSPASTPGAATSGIRVTAMIGPICPGPQRSGQVCTKPYEGLFSVTDSRGAEVASFTTDQNGQAVVDLPSGDYTVTPKIEGRFPSGAPAAVTVSAGEYVEVNLELDTGIR